MKANAITNSHGDLTATVTGYGTALSSSATYGPFGTLAASAGPVMPVGFQGGYTDPATGQVNMWSRWYDPGTGAFTAGDAITQSTGPGSGDPAVASAAAGSGAGGDPLAAAAGDPLFSGNPYAYAAGDPLTVADPTGRYALPPVGGAAVLDLGAAVGAGAGGGAEAGLACGPFAWACVTAGAVVGAAAGVGAYYAGRWWANGWNSIWDGSYPGELSVPDPAALGAPMGSPAWTQELFYNCDVLHLGMCAQQSGQHGGWGSPGAGSGGWGGPCSGYCAAAAPPRPVCDQACLQAKWVQHNALTPLARPPLTASITQAQLDARRNKAERNVEAQAGKEDLRGVNTRFEGQNATTSTAPGQGGGSSGGGGVPPAPACMPEGPGQPGNAAEAVRAKVAEMQAAMTDAEAGRTTYAAAQVTTAEGNEEMWVAGAGKSGYVRPAIRGEALNRTSPAPSELSGRLGINDAEMNLFRAAQEQGGTINAIGATRPVCALCQRRLPDEIPMLRRWNADEAST